VTKTTGRIVFEYDNRLTVSTDMHPRDNRIVIRHDMERCGLSVNLDTARWLAGAIARAIEIIERYGQER